jgi:hypothetical protein
MVDLTVTNAGRRFLGIDQSRGPDRVFATVQINVSGLLDPEATIDAARAGIRLRAMQDLRWGLSDNPNVSPHVQHPCAFYGIPTADACRKATDESFRRGVGSWAHILIEEVAKGFELLATPVDLAALKQQLGEIQAVCMAWSECIDRRQGFGGVDGKVIAVDELAGEGNAHG